MKSKQEKQKEIERQTLVANSLYELGMSDEVIKIITKIDKETILKYRDEKNLSIDKNGRK